MTLTRALTQLRSIGLPVLRTADAASFLDVTQTNASAIMARLAKHNQLVRIKRGLWAFHDTDPLTIPPYLTGPLPCYISLQSALYYHDMVSQIPDVLFCVSLARTRVYASPLATVSVHHIAGDFFFGYEEQQRGYIRMASPEKALVDLLYLGAARSRLFAALPEIEFPAGFNGNKARAMVEKIADKKRRTYAGSRLDQLLSAAG